MKARAIRGTALSVAGFGGSQFIRLASNLVLTRILFPEAFGLMALVQVLLVGLLQFSDLSLRPSIIYSDRGDDPDFLNTAWTLQVIRGVILWIAACALAVPFANFYEQEALAKMVPFLGLTTLITGLASINMIHVNRHLKLGALTWLELGSQLVGSISMILLAWWLQSVWALVIGSLITALTTTILSHILLPGQRSRFAWDKPALWEMFHFGKWILFATVAGFFINNGDRVVLGKFVALESLAIYTIALMMASVPQMLNHQLIERVLFPLYKNRPPAASPKNRQRIGQARLLLIAGLLCLAAIFAFSGEALITFLYDERYQTAGPLLVLLSLSIIPRIVIASYDRLFLANGNSRDFTILVVVAAILRFTALVFLISNFGLIGAVMAPFFVDILLYPVFVYYIRRYKGWYPAQDLLIVGVSGLIGVIALWNSPAALALVTTFLSSITG